MHHPIFIILLALLPALPLVAQTGISEDALDSLSKDNRLSTATVKARRVTTAHLKNAENGLNISKEELFRAACCNLGESFTTNPSVDVNYTDAATGARQIRLLGLSGTYVQMLTENLPAFRGAALPYALSYVPGTWMQSIQVSKGASSVKNGYESITGQMNIEYLKPEDEQGAVVNLYGNTKSRFEANAQANVHLNNDLSTEVLAHFENSWNHHDENHDGFLDQPNVRQYNFQNRWLWKTGRYIFHGGLSALNENRDGGQTTHGAMHNPDGTERYRIGIETERYEAYMKHAFIVDPTNGGNLALMATASMHEADAGYGYKLYDVNEKNVYAQLMYETNLGELHNLSAGMSLNYDYLGQHYRLTQTRDDAQIRKDHERETVPGLYAQYTFNLYSRLIAMAGFRVDHSSAYGTFATPRVHLKYAPTDALTLRASAGKGYRTVHPLAEYNNLLSSGRSLIIADRLRQESAWNYGVSAQYTATLFGKALRLGAEYYYTRFHNQAVVDYDSDPSLITIDNLRGRSYSHTAQFDASYPFFDGFTLTAAWRLQNVKTSYGGRLLTKPLTSRYKGLVTASYKTPLGLWQFDLTLQLNGGGRLPSPPAESTSVETWPSHFHAFEQLSAQVTRWFRHFSVYAGGENLTARRQHRTIWGAADPWSTSFEPTLVWGPVHGAMAYVGLRLNFGKL